VLDHGVRSISSRKSLLGSEERIRATVCGLKDELARPTILGLASENSPKSVESMMPAGPETLSW
jgi:hypothetical protein